MFRFGDSNEECQRRKQRRMDWQYLAYVDLPHDIIPTTSLGC